MSDYFTNPSPVIKPEVFESAGLMLRIWLQRSAHHDSAIDDVVIYTSTNSPPVRRRNASTYLAELFSITSFGRRGAGGVLSQSKVSR